MTQNHNSKPNQAPHKKPDAPQTLAEGLLFTSARGKGFVILDENGERVNIEDQIDLNTGLSGDHVKVRLYPQKKNFPLTGGVREIITRAKTSFVGTVDKKGDVCFLIPDHKRMYTDIVISPKDASVVKHEQKALFAIVHWDDPKKNPEGKLLKIIGNKGDNDAEMASVALDRGFDADFPADVDEEADALPKSIAAEEIAKRRDFRKVPTFTIDPADAKDFDDALSVQTLTSGEVEVGIHIADVTHYVRPGSKLDQEARTRGTSVYLADRTIPMLPEIISNDLCSLRPDEDRLAFSAVFTFSKDSVDGKKYKIVDEWFGRSVIHSIKRFAYEDAQKVLDKRGQEPFIEELTILSKLAQKLRKERSDEGAISFEKSEIKVTVDKTGKAIDISRKDRIETQKIIEDWMLLANQRVPKFVNEKSKGERPFVYRVHDIPSPEKIQNLAVFLRSLGYKLETKDGKVTSSALSNLLDQVDGTPEENVIQTATIRSMARAIYSTKNIGHFGLGFEDYTHFTSPIRRYPDMMVHRLLDECLRGAPISQKETAEYQALLVYASEREGNAAEAERDSIKYKQVEFLQDRVGETFDGLISGVTEHGIFVEEAKTGAEGMVRLRDLGDDFYIFDEKHYRLVGQRTKKTHRLGDKVRIKLTGTNLERKMLDWVFV